MIEIQELKPGEIIFRGDEQWTVEALANSNGHVPIKIYWCPGHWWYDFITPYNAHEFSSPHKETESKL